MNKQLIYDVGMNNGDDTAFYLHCGYNVLAIEANPEMCQQAATRFSNDIKAGKLLILNVAVSDAASNLPFWICQNHPEWSSFDRSVASRNGADHHSIFVESRRFSEILDEFGVPFYIKIDIEGMDWACVESLRGRELPRYMSIEQSPYVVNRMDLLREIGFEGFKCISQKYFLPLQIPKSAEELSLEACLFRIERNLAKRSFASRVFRRLGWGSSDRRQVRDFLSQLRGAPQWTFGPGSSGNFGENTLGRWLEFTEFKETVIRANEASRAGEPSVFWGHEPHSFWADFHMSSNLY